MILAVAWQDDVNINMEAFESEMAMAEQSASCLVLSPCCEVVGSSVASLRAFCVLRPAFCILHSREAAASRPEIPPCYR